jgi:3-hydroxyacyl-CoA dehydrogenase
MGTGIAIVANRVAGIDVKIIDTSEEVLSKSKSFIGMAKGVIFREMV